MTDTLDKRLSKIEDRLTAIENALCTFAMSVTAMDAKIDVLLARVPSAPNARSPLGHGVTRAAR